MSQTLCLTGGRIFDGANWHTDMDLLVRDGRVLAMQPAPAAGNHRRIDVKGGLLVPAFIDLQVYGADGWLFARHPRPEALDALAAHGRRHGTARILVTIPTLPQSAVAECLQALRGWKLAGGDIIAGLHLEGPFIHPDRRGAHIAEFVRPLQAADVTWLLNNGRDLLSMLTLAPELAEPEQLQPLRQAGTVLSAGHSNATFEEARRFPERGIATVTHLFNAMPPLHHRAPGLPGAVLTATNLYASIIPDGIHVHDHMVRMAWQLMRGRLFFITDAVTESDGHYAHRLQGDRYVMPDGTLSGSALTMPMCVQRGVRHIGIPLDDCLRMASAIPAQLMGWSDCGHLQHGAVGPVWLHPEDLSVAAVFF